MTANEAIRIACRLARLDGSAWAHAIAHAFFAEDGPTPCWEVTFSAEDGADVTVRFASCDPFGSASLL